MYIEGATAVYMRHVYWQSNVLYFSCYRVKKNSFLDIFDLSNNPHDDKKSCKPLVSTTMVPMIKKMYIYGATMS